MIDLSWITPELGVGGSYPSAQRLAREHGIAAAVDLRADMWDEEVLVEADGLELLHLPAHEVSGVSLPHLCDGVAFVVRHVEAGRKVIVRCEHGIGRSALLALC